MEKNNKTKQDILNECCSFKQHISNGNYNCVGVPYVDALRAMEEYASLQSSDKDERIKELEAILSRVLYWDNGELPENAIRDIKQALSGSEKKAPVIISTNTPMPGR